MFKLILNLMLQFVTVVVNCFICLALSTSMGRHRKHRARTRARFDREQDLDTQSSRPSSMTSQRDSEAKRTETEVKQDLLLTVEALELPHLLAVTQNMNWRKIWRSPRERKECFVSRLC